jgi:hypothetical protein
LKSPGQVAFEKYNELCIVSIDIKWEQVPPSEQKHWEDIGQAAIKQWAAHLIEQVARDKLFFPQAPVNRDE